MHDVQLPVLTPNTLIHGINIVNLEEVSGNIDEYELRKRSSFVQKCKEKTWTRWTSEYLKALHEQHNLKHKSHELTKGGEKNRGTWNIEIVQHINKEKDGNILIRYIRASKVYLIINFE